MTYFPCAVLAFLLAVCPLLHAEEDREKTVGITAETDREKIEIGDRIKLDVRARNISGKEVLFPETTENLGEFSVIGSRPLEEGWPKGRITGKEYVLSVYTTGTHVIPPVEVKYRSSGEDEWRTKESPQIPIEVKSVLTGNDTDIKDLKGLAVLRGIGSWLFLILAAFFTAGIFFWLMQLRRKFRALAEKAARKSAYEIAYEELGNLKTMDLPGKGLVKEYYFRLSNIVRHYLENRFSYRAPEMTTEEFLEAVKRSEELTKEHKDLLKDFLSRCDMVKFAKYGPTPLEILDSFKSAERLVDQTREKEEEEGES